MTFTVFFTLLAMLLAFSVSAADEKIMRRHRTIDAAGEVEETIMKAAKADEQSYGAMRMVEVEDHGEEGKEFMLQVEVVDHDCQGREGTDPVKHQGTQRHYKVHPTNSDQEKHEESQPQSPTDNVQTRKKAATDREAVLMKQIQEQKEISAAAAKKLENDGKELRALKSAGESEGEEEIASEELQEVKGAAKEGRHSELEGKSFSHSQHSDPHKKHYAVKKSSQMLWESRKKALR